MKKFICTLLLFFTTANFSFAGISILGELAQERSLQLGEKYEGTINLKNTGQTPCQVNVYQTDYRFDADGTNIYGEPGSSARSNAGWLSVSPGRLTILPDQIATVYYTVQIPERKELASINPDISATENLDLTGTYWSMVMIEPMPEELSPENIQDRTGKIQMGIKTKIRYGIQIVTNIGDSGTRRMEFRDKKLIKQDGKTILQMDIENTGQRWLFPSVWVEIYAEGGKAMGRFDGDKKRIYPGCSVRQKIELTDIPAGQYQALVVADNGDDYVFGARYNFEIK